MVDKFRNYIDSETDFGRINVSGSELLSRFAESKGMSAQQREAFRWKLECAGIL